MHAVDWRRAAGWAAMVAPLLMWSEFITMGTSRYGYNLLTRPFSDLATRGTPNSGLFDLGFFLVPGALTAILGLGLYSVSRGQAWRIGALMVTASGVFLVAAGAFPQDPNSMVEGLLHGTMAQTCFALASVAPLLLFLGSGNQSLVGPPRRVWLAAAIAAFAIEAVAIAVRPLASYPDGLFQRPFTAVLTIWFITTGAWLLRGRSFEGLSVPD
ncbi:MAG TPA: DUF998 domain-containing protein [Candidatus Dormibacteraeota bacterium]